MEETLRGTTLRKGTSSLFGWNWTVDNVNVDNVLFYNINQELLRKQYMHILIYLTVQFASLGGSIGWSCESIGVNHLAESFKKNRFIHESPVILGLSATAEFAVLH